MPTARQFLYLLSQDDLCAAAGLAARSAQTTINGIDLQVALFMNAATGSLRLMRATIVQSRHRRTALLGQALESGALVEADGRSAAGAGAGADTHRVSSAAPSFCVCTTIGSSKRSPWPRKRGSVRLSDRHGWEEA